MSAESNKRIDSIIESLVSTHVADKETVLSFENRQLKLITAEDAESVSKEIENQPDLEELIFKGNTISHLAAERIAASLKKCKNLRRALWSDMFTGRLKSETPPALKFLCSAMMTARVALVELDLSDNALSVAGADAIKDFLRSPACFSLEILKLNNDGLGIGGGKIIAQALTECWEASKSVGKVLKLKVFVAGRNRLEIAGAEALATAFKKIGTLEEVSMPQNGIYHKGITALAEAFSRNPNLARINLSDNTFTAVGALSMSKVLPNLKKLEVINFSDCLLRSQGGLHLAKILKSNCPNLKVLNVSGNEMNKESALFLGDAVTNNKTAFEKLEIDCNNIGQSGIEEMKELFSRKNALNCLGSLSDDEGSADEEENENEEAEAEQEQESGEEDEEAEEEQNKDAEAEQVSESNKARGLIERKPFVEVPPPAVVDISTVENKLLSLSVDSKVIKQTSTLNPVDQFLVSFDAASLLEMGDSAPDMILHNLLNKLYNSKFVVDIVAKISALITPNCGNELKNLSLLSCKKILSSSFALCDVPLFNDYLAAKLGLIKSEDKDVTSNVQGFLYVLEKECSEDYFNKTTRDVLKFLIDRHVERLDSSKRIFQKNQWTNLLNALQI